MIVGCLVALVVLYVDQRDADAAESASKQPQAQREELMAQTQQFVIRVNTYGPSWLDDKNQMPRYVDGVSELLTAKFAAAFEESVVIPEQQVSQTGYGRSAKVHAVGVARMDADTATVLVGFTRTDSYPRPRKPERRLKLAPDPERWAVALVRTDGEWLVDNYAAISELPEGEEANPPPSSEPSGDPSAPAPDPSAPASSGSGQQ